MTAAWAPQCRLGASPRRRLTAASLAALGTAGTTYSFVGASNKIPAALLGHFLFSSNLTALGWLGVLFGLASGLGFSASKYT